MNFATLTGNGGQATHFVTTQQMPVTKYQQNVNTNGTTLSQVVGVMGGLGDGVQYMRALDGGATLQAQPQIITLPITLPGTKPGDPQQTVQIQVLNPNLMQAQQPKYQMQIPIQGFQQGGAVLTVSYSTDGSDGIQLLGNSLPEGLQMLAAHPQDIQLMQQQHEVAKDPLQLPQQTILFQGGGQLVVGGADKFNNNTTSDNNNVRVKMECDEESSGQGAESSSEGVMWQNASQDIANYLSKLPPQQTLPVSLQQFLRLNPSDLKQEAAASVDVVQPSEPEIISTDTDKMADGGLEEGTSKPKRKKKYKKKASKPARPKPGQVVIATALDGTVIFCCPECHMAYPEKEQLEHHLAVHKIERRFICGLCGAGLKRKEHLERHKLGHNPERPYVCTVCRKGFKRKEHLNLHTVIHSGEKTELCLECGKGFYRKDHLRKHMRSHATKRAREESLAGAQEMTIMSQGMQSKAGACDSILPEITIHVPTSSNMQMPVQISVPHHLVSSLGGQSSLALSQPLDELLAQHS